MTDKVLNILGIRGLPAAHGGFETFAARLALYLVERGWTVNVYCQLDSLAAGNVQSDFTDDWNGVRRIYIGAAGSGSAASVRFDWRSVRDVIGKPGVDLVLGYNTAIFCIMQRLSGRRIFMNMDGIEWKRAKWALPIKVWFYLNEFVGYHTCTTPIADHPEIARHLRRHGWRASAVIPYGSDRIEVAPDDDVRRLGVEPNGYALAIGRIEPENSLLEVVSAFSRRKRALKLVVLGNFVAGNAYHDAVRAIASEDVEFPGAIYASATVSALRFHARVYVHGHQVGGTNPSLVEALGAGNAVIAHNNPFNRWVAGAQQKYFGNTDELAALFDGALLDEQWLEKARRGAVRRHGEAFTWERVLKDYEDLLAAATGDQHHQPVDSNQETAAWVIPRLRSSASIRDTNSTARIEASRPVFMRWRRGATRK